MGGLEGLINILDSDGGFGSLEMQVVTLFWPMNHSFSIIFLYWFYESFSFSQTKQQISWIWHPDYLFLQWNLQKLRMVFTYQVTRAIQKITVLLKCELLSHEPLVLLSYICVLFNFLFFIVCFGDRLEAAMQRLTNLCSVLNDMEPICVLNHVFVLREVSLHFSSVNCSLDTDLLPNMSKRVQNR